MIEKLQNIVQRYTDNEEIIISGDTVLLTDLGLNSYELVQLVCEIEDKFSIEIPDRKIRDFKTIQNVLDYITAQ